MDLLSWLPLAPSFQWRMGLTVKMIWRVGLNSRRAAMRSIATKIGCTAETLRKWVRQADRDAGLHAGPTTEEKKRIKELEREVRELKRANQILRKASAYFAQAELDRPLTKW